MTTFSGQVAASADDAHEQKSNTNFNATAVTLRCEASATDAWVGAFRIDNVTVTPPAVIQDAYAQIVVPTATRDSADEDLDMEASDDANDFSTEADVVNRSLTGNSVAWEDNDVGSGSFVNTPSFTAAAQAVVNRPGWANNNAMVVVIAGQDEAPTEDGFRGTPYDQSTADACKLVIEWVPGGSIPRRGINHPVVNPLIRR